MLQVEGPVLWAHFERVWSVREAHLVTSSMPSKYCFLLKCCGAASCHHPRCKDGKSDFKCFENGPSIDDALPIPVVNREPCSRNCNNCFGHYVQEISLHHNKVPSDIPSVLLTQEFEADCVLNVDRCTALAEQSLLSPFQVSIFWNHLTEVRENRQRGAAKAKITRAKKAAAKI